MNKPVYNFQTQLKKGKAAEAEFAKHFKLFGETLQDSGVRDYDFTTTSGKRVELKSDFYQSGNFFIERFYGNPVADKPGSMWQSANKNVDVFIYWFVNMGEVYIFTDLKQTTTYLEELIKEMNLTPVHVQNTGFHGIGYKVPKHLLNHLCIKEDWDAS